MARSTRDNTLSTIRRADAWCHLTYGRCLTKATRPMLIEWLATYEHAPTRNHHLARLRSFFLWRDQRGARANPVANIIPIREPRRLPRPLAHEVAVAWAVASHSDPQAKLAIYLGLYGGLRISEIAGLAWSDIDLDSGTIRIIGKGDKERMLPIAPGLSPVLAEARSGGWLFPSPRGGHLHLASVRRLMYRALGDAHAGVPHQMRHTFATSLLRGGSDIRSVQVLLGHASLTSTQIYTEVLVEDTRPDVARLDFGVA